MNNYETVNDSRMKSNQIRKSRKEKTKKWWRWSRNRKEILKSERDWRDWAADGGSLFDHLLDTDEQFVSSNTNEMDFSEDIRLVCCPFQYGEVSSASTPSISPHHSGGYRNRIKNKKRKQRRNVRRKHKQAPRRDFFKKVTNDISSNIFENYPVKPSYEDEQMDIYNISVRRDLQVVLMGDTSGFSLSKRRMVEIQQFIINEMERISFCEDSLAPQLRFHNCKFLRVGWLLLTCDDEETLKWILGLRPPRRGNNFIVAKASEAPWKSMRICITIYGSNIDIHEMRQLLSRQNSNLQVTTWCYVGTIGENGSWNIHFLVPGTEVRNLEEAGWAVFFMLNKIPVASLEGFTDDR